MRLALVLAILLLAGCGRASDDTIEPVPQANPESANALMSAAEQAAGNAQARMGADAATNNSVEAK
ncbi:hypothetical protein OMW55_06395 [Sphingomonas sp. BN140010]|uniref:Lipoprotein n=1 Tax=Sphingomonas arvum TaxID=2992113 RepID=A0ABT3JED1_9SPHN|nr:hypothetical protein [Sphingomonas sp. BN140010]MCW3797432.1 hypothetical protein [Sphingomonas sp. BN140010]